MTDATNLQRVREALTENPLPLIEFAIERLADLGSSPEWSMDQNYATTEGLVNLAPDYGLPGAGDQTDEDLRFWESVGEALGTRV